MAAADGATVTVSQALKYRNAVSAKTAAKTAEGINELGYFGNARATQKTTNESGSGHTQGHFCSRFDCTTGKQNETRKSAVPVAPRSPAGVIALDYHKDYSPIVGGLHDYLPVVINPGPKHAEIDKRQTIAIHDFLGAEEATRHLHRLGHETVFVVEPLGVDASQC